MKLKDLIEDNPYAPKLKDLYKVLEMYEKNKKKNQSLKDFISEMDIVPQENQTTFSKV